MKYFIDRYQISCRGCKPLAEGNVVLENFRNTWLLDIEGGATALLHDVEAETLQVTLFRKVGCRNPRNLQVCGPRQPPMQKTLQIPRSHAECFKSGFGTIPWGGRGGVVANREPGSYIEFSPLEIVGFEEDFDGCGCGCCDSWGWPWLQQFNQLSQLRLCSRLPGGHVFELRTRLLFFGWALRQMPRSIWSQCNPNLHCTCPCTGPCAWCCRVAMGAEASSNPTTSKRFKCIDGTSEGSSAALVATLWLGDDFHFVGGSGIQVVVSLRLVLFSFFFPSWDLLLSSPSQLVKVSSGLFWRCWRAKRMGRALKDRHFGSFPMSRPSNFQSQAWRVPSICSVDLKLGPNYWNKEEPFTT